MFTKKKNKDNQTEKYAFFGGITAILGYIVGTLTAPSSGKKTRAEIKKNALAGKKQLEEELKALADDSAKIVKEAELKSSELNTKAREDVKSLIIKADDNKNKMKELISAIRSGQDISDADLKRAIESGKVSIEHLREFLKK